MAKKRKTGAQRVSRNKKTYWKKGVDVTDVEKFAETQRENERLGFAEKSDAELFFFHKSASDGNGNDPHGSGSKQSVRKVELKCFQNLKPNSAVPPFLEQKRGSKVTKRKQAKRLKKLAAITRPKIDRKSATKDSTAYDLWQDKKSEYPYLSPDVELGYLRATKRLLPKVPSSCKQITTKLPAVEHPHPGQSYNPAYDDHQDLLKQAIDAEAKKISSEQSLLKRLELKEEPATAATAFAELIEGLDLVKKKENPEEHDDDDEIDQSSDDGKTSATDNQSESTNENHVTDDKSEKSEKSHVIDGENRKLSKTRRRELLEKLKKDEKMQEKLTKKRLNDVFRVKSLLREIKTEEKRTNEKISKKLKEKEQKLLKPSTLSRHKYEEGDVPLNISTEIAGSLRSLKPDGNLMEDRFKSLQRRNIIETRALHLKYSRKYALKKYQVRDSEVTPNYVPR